MAPRIRLSLLNRNKAGSPPSSPSWSPTKNDQSLPFLFPSDDVDNNNTASNEEDDDENKYQSRRWMYCGFMKRLTFIVCAFAVVGYILPFHYRTTPTLSLLKDHQPKISQTPGECTIWLAPPSIKGMEDVGLGIYTTRDIQKHEFLSPAADGGLSIPVVDYMNGPRTRTRMNWLKTWNEYWWGRGVPEHVSFEGKFVEDFVISFGSYPNHHCLLDSIDYSLPEDPYNDEVVDRFHNAGTGAVSYSMGRLFYATRSLKAGDEIFLSYGYCKRKEYSHAFANDIPMPEDFQEAAKLIQQTWDQRAYLRQTDLNWNMERISNYVKPWLPKTMDELKTLMSSWDKRNSDLNLPAHISKEMGTIPRSVEWIKEHGMCLENLAPGPSEISGAGQGAFSQFSIAKGEMIVPMPFVQIMDRNLLNMYSRENKTAAHGQQLLMNYCLGHPETPLLLCPNTNVLLINHCSSRPPFQKHCPNGPNAKFQWASGWDKNSPNWQKMTLKEMAEQDGRGLAMEVVATREIRPGEEVFVDYGEDWESSWLQHVRTWQPPKTPRDMTWISAKQANHDPNAPIPSAFISGNLRYVVSHPYLFTACAYRPTRRDNEAVFHEERPEWTDLTDQELLELYSDNGDRLYGKLPVYTQPHEDLMYWPCSVLKETPKTNPDDIDPPTYLVGMHESPNHEGPPWSRNELPRYLTHYPRRLIHFFVQPGASDQKLPNAFRHPIGIPNDLLPDQWRTKTRH